MEKTKKSLMIISLSCLAISCIMLILAVFKVEIFKGIPLRLLLIFATLALSCGLAINEIPLVKRKNVLGYVGLGLLSLSVLFALIIFCTNLLTTYSVFNKITGVVSVLSVTFIIIISIYTKLEKSMLGLQIPSYISLILLAIMSCLLICGVEVFEINGMSQTFIVLIIVSVGLLISSSVVASKKKVEDKEKKENKDEMIKISKLEYENLLKENEMLKNEIEKLKAEN